MLKRALCFFLLKSCGLPNDIISFFGPQLKKFADPWTRASIRCGSSVDVQIIKIYEGVVLSTARPYCYCCSLNVCEMADRRRGCVPAGHEHTAPGAPAGQGRSAGGQS